MTPERLIELTKLANSGDEYDRIKAAQAIDLPLELQEILASWKIWEILKEDERYWVREAINKRIEEEKDRIKAEFKEKISK